MKKVLIIIGTRPEAIKTIMLHKLLMNNDLLEPCLLCTGQHAKMVEEVLALFEVTPDILFSIPDEIDSLNSKTAFLLTEIEKEINLLKPDYIIVQGDTLSSFCGALSAYFHKIPLIHIEAGLRTGNKWAPFPEELLRLINDTLSDYHMAPTLAAVENLRHLSLRENQLKMTGNTGIDALSYILQKINSGELLPSQHLTEEIGNDLASSVALLTCHRRESHEIFIEKYLMPLDRVATEIDLRILFPMHPNPVLQEKLDEVTFKNIRLMPPLNYVDMVYAMKSSQIIFSDSGGIQEEAVFLGKPVIVIRNETERQEAIEKGLNELYDSSNLQDQIIRLLSQGERASSHLYGDGNASAKIVDFLNALIN